MKNNRHFSFIPLCFVIILSLPNVSLIAQNTNIIENPAQYWLNVGLGGGSFGMSGAVTATYSTADELYSLRFTSSGPLRIFQNSESIWDVGALYGIHTHSDSYYASIAGGIAVVGGVDLGKLLKNELFNDTYEELHYTTVGFPIEAQFSRKMFSFMRICLYGFANVNAKHSFAGIAACLQFGVLQ